MSIHAETVHVVTCDAPGCEEEYCGTVGDSAHSVLVESGFSTEDGKHYCGDCPREETP